MSPTPVRGVATFDFPAGAVEIDPERIWAELQNWLDTNPSRRSSVFRDSLGYCCRLTWDNATKTDTGGTSARSKLGIADAVANALQAAQGAP